MKTQENVKTCSAKCAVSNCKICEDDKSNSCKECNSEFELIVKGDVKECSAKCPILNC